MKLPGIFLQKHTIILIAILMTGLFLRTYCLTCESLWLDEGIAIIWAGMKPAYIIDVVAKDVHQPLYFLVLHYWIAALGDSEFTLRFLSVIFGSLSIIVIYIIGNHMYGRRTGILSSLFLSLSHFHINQSQEARPYALLALLTLLSMYFFIRLLEKRNYINLLGYVAFSTLLIYTHIFGIFTVISQNVYVLASRFAGRKPVALRRWLLIQAAILLLFLPWAGILAGQVMTSQEPGSNVSWTPGPTPITIFFTFFEYSYFGFFVFLLLAGYLALKRLQNKGLSLKGLKAQTWDYISNLVTDRRTSLLLVWLFIPIALAYALSLLFTPFYSNKFTIGAAMAFYLLLAVWLRGMKRRRAVMVTLVLFMALSLMGLVIHFSDTDKKEPWRDVAEQIDSKALPGDLLLFNVYFGMYGPIDYYLETPGLEAVGFPQSRKQVDEGDLDELKDLTDAHDRIWLILYQSTDGRGLIKGTIEETHVQTDYSVYERPEDMRQVEDAFGFKMHEEIELILFERRQD